MTTTRQTVTTRADACKHIMSLVGIPPDDHIFIILQDNGVLSAGLGFLTRADKACQPDHRRRSTWTPPSFGLDGKNIISRGGVVGRESVVEYIMYVGISAVESVSRVSLYHRSMEKAFQCPAAGGQKQTPLP